MSGHKATGRHAGPCVPRSVFSDPGDSRWRTDVVVFVLVPFALASMLAVSVLVWLDGGADRWAGLVLGVTPSAVLLPAAWLRWRMLETSYGKRPLMLYYMLLGAAIIAGVVAASAR